MISSKLLRAFEETHYIVHHQPPFTLRIGQHSTELDALLGALGQDCAAFITAWNPMSEITPDAENHLHQQKLLDELTLKGLSHLPGIGQHPSNNWPGEESLLILGLELNDARVMARAFHQLAFVWGEKHCPIQVIET